MGEQGLLGLVDEEDGMLLLVEEAEGPVRVVCPNAQSEINESAAVATMRIRFTINLLSMQSLSFCKQLCQSLNRLEWTPARDELWASSRPRWWSGPDGTAKIAAEELK